jgi:hypothetical protein
VGQVRAQGQQSAGKANPDTTGKGNPWIASTLGEAGIGAARTKTFPGSRYHRLARRHGKQGALVAVGNSILTIAWHLLPDPEAHFTDLGPDWHDRLAPIRRKRQSSPNWNASPGRRSPSRTPPPNQPPHPDPAPLRSAGYCRAPS